MAHRPGGLPGAVVSGPIPNYLIFAVLVTLFGCMPAGIVALVFSSQVNTKAALGDEQGAWASSQQAKFWCWIALGLGVAVWGLAFLSIFVTLLFGVGR